MHKIFKHLNTLTIISSMINTAALSFFILGRKDFALDEIASVLITRDWSKMFYYIKYKEGNMWLYYLLLHFWQYLGSSEYSIRVLSVLFAVATVPLVFLIGEKLFNSQVARISTFLFSFNIFLIQNAQNARAYSLVLFLTALSSYFFIQYISSTAKKYLVGLTILNILAVYTHMYAVFVIGAQLASMAFLPQFTRKYKSILLTLPILLIAVLPLFSAPSMHSGQINWIAKPDIKNLIGTFLILSMDFPPVAAIYIFLLVYTGFNIYKSRPKDKVTLWKHSFPVLLVVLPVITSFIFSTLVKPIYISAYFIICLLPFTLLIGYALSKIQKRWIYMTILTIVILLSTLRLYGWYTDSPKLMLVIRNYNEDWHPVANFLTSQVKQNDKIIFFPPYAKDNINFYLTDTTNLPVLLVKFNKESLINLSQQYPRIWYVTVDYTDANIDSEKKLLEQSLFNQYSLIKKTQFKRMQISLLTAKSNLKSVH